MMKLKKLLLFGLILSVLLISGCSSTAGSNEENVFYKVITLQYLVDINMIPQPISPIEGFIRILLFITLFSIFFSVTKLINLQPGPGTAIAGVISLMSSIFIPSSVLIFASASYSLIVSLIILLVPIGAAAYLYFTVKEWPWLRFIFLGVITLLVWLFRNLLVGIVEEGVAESLFQSVGGANSQTGTTEGILKAISATNDWMLAVLIILIIATIISFFSIFVSRVNVAGKLSGMKEGFLNRRTEKKAMNEVAKEQKEEGRVAREAEREEKFAIEEFVDLEEMKKAIEGYSGNTSKGLNSAVGRILNKTKRNESRYMQRLRRLQRNISGLKLSAKKQGQIAPIMHFLEDNSKILLGKIVEFNNLLESNLGRDSMDTRKQELVNILDEAIKFDRAETESLEELKKILKKEIDKV